MKVVKNDQVGPGHYTCPPNDTSLVNLKPNCAFTSKQPRFSHCSAKDPQQKKLDLLYKVARLQNMDLVKQRVDLKKLSEENYSELVEKVEELVEFVEDAVPGPGHYTLRREFDTGVAPKGLDMKYNY